VSALTDRIREAVMALPTHRAGGYEWECDGCQERSFEYREAHPGENINTWSEEWRAAHPCPHSGWDDEGDAPISRDDVLALLERLA
jgi:hypothetical protein